MSTLHNAHPMIGFFASVFSRGAEDRSQPSLFRRMLNVVMTWQNRATMRHHLLNMNEHMLKDIGLSRADAQREANKHVWEN
jgi:uncharacterized protein YjiS (DUF1127 family)